MSHPANRLRPYTLSPYITPTRIENGRVVPLERRPRVCIYGCGHGHREAPLDDPSWEVWALNLIVPLDRQGRFRPCRFFDLHQRVAQSADDLRWIAACPVPIYLPPDLLDASPMAVPYPLADVEAAFGSYWAVSFAYMTALAVLEGFREIGLYGIELAYGTRRERTVEASCMNYWLGYFEALGVQFHLPAASRLGAHPFRYGFEYAAEIDEVDAYLRGFEDSDRDEFRTLDLRRRGVRAEMPKSVGG